jgi:hypothetical protein
MSPRLKEFFTAWLAGLAIGLATMVFRNAKITPFLHIIGGVALILDIDLKLREQPSVADEVSIL